MSDRIPSVFPLSDDLRIYMEGPEPVLPRNPAVPLEWPFSSIIEANKVRPWPFPEPTEITKDME